jgi:hypothetical protein
MLENLTKKLTIMREIIKEKESIREGDFNDLYFAINVGAIKPGDLIRVNDQHNLLFENLPDNRGRVGRTFYGKSVLGGIDWKYETEDNNKLGEWHGYNSNWKSPGFWKRDKITFDETTESRPALFWYLQNDNYVCVSIEKVNNKRHLWVHTSGYQEKKHNYLLNIEKWENLGSITSSEIGEKWRKHLGEHRCSFIPPRDGDIE